MKKIVKMLVMLIAIASLAGCAKKPSITVPSGVLEFTVGDKDFTSENTEEKLLVGVTAVDNGNGNEAALEVIDLGGFDINKIGLYTITIEATSGSKKSVTETRQVKVVDRTQPVLNVPSGILEFYEKDETFTSENISEKLLAGVTVTDAVDDNIEPSVSDLGGFDIGVVGEYVITVTATNTGNKTVTATRTVKVLERSFPVITLPEEDVILVTGETLTEAEVLEALKAKGFSVSDEFDNDLEIAIINFSSINFNQEGPCTLNINVTNKYGKTSTAEVEVTVYENRKPEVLATGILVMDITDTFDPTAFLTAFKRGIIVKDDKGTINIDDDVELSVNDNDINNAANFLPNVAGTYVFQVTVRDAQGESVTFEKKVKVVEPRTRIIVIGTEAYDISAESNYSFNGITPSNDYEVAIYTFRGEQEMFVPASGYAWLLDADYKLKQVLSGEGFLSGLTMEEDDLLVVFGKEKSQDWAGKEAQLNNVVTLYNIEITELLDTPVVSEQANVLNWDAIEGATGYDIVMNGELYQRVTETSFDLTTVIGINQTENVFAVRAVNSQNRSLLSADVMHTYSATAQGVDISTMWFELEGNRNDEEGDVLVWGSVDGAVQYRIFVDMKQIAIVNAVDGQTKYQYDIKTGNLEWRVIPENINYEDENGQTSPLLDDLGQPMYDRNGQPILKPFSTRTFNSYTFNFTVVALVPNEVMTPSDSIGFVVNRIEQPILFASKYDIGRDDVYDGISEYGLAPHPVFLPGGTFAQYDQHIIDNDSFIIISRGGMEKLTAMSYLVNGYLEIMRISPQELVSYETNQILVPVDGIPGIYPQPAYVTSLSMLTMPKSALMALNLLGMGLLNPDPNTVYFEPNDFFGVKFNPAFLADLVDGKIDTPTNDKFIVNASEPGQSGVCVWSQLVYRGDNARWYDSVPSTRMLLTVPGRADAVGSTIMNFAPGTIEIIGTN